MTAQIPDVLQFRGEAQPLFTTPLEALPTEVRRNFVPSGLSANWRGYRCLWEIRDDDCLYLVDIAGTICTAVGDQTALVKSCGGRHHGPCEPREAKVSDFAVVDADGPAFADWYSGELKIPRGRLVNYVHMGFASEYERYQYLTIIGGRLVGERPVAGAARPQFGLSWIMQLLRWRT